MLFDDISALTDIHRKIIELESGCLRILFSRNRIRPAAGARAEFQLVLATADRQRTIDALMNDILSHFRSLWILPERQITHAILRTGIRKFHIQDICHGSHQIGQADDPVTAAPGFDRFRPLYDQRDPMTSLIDVRFCSTEHITGIMAFCFQLFKVCHRRTAVV